MKTSTAALTIFVVSLNGGVFEVWENQDRAVRAARSLQADEMGVVGLKAVHGDRAVKIAKLTDAINCAQQGEGANCANLYSQRDAAFAA